MSTSSTRSQTTPRDNRLEGMPVDIASSAYQWRADRNPEDNPPKSWLVSHGEAALPTLTKMLESKDEDTYRYALVAAMKVAGDEKLPDCAERGLKEAILNPRAVPRDANCDFYQAARHLQRFGARSIPVFVEACQAGAKSQDWRQSLRAAYGLSLYGKGAKDELAVLEETLKAFSGHKDYRGCIKPPLEKAIAAIKDDKK